MKYRWLIIILVCASLSCQGCAVANDKDIAADTQPTPTAIHSLGDVQERTRDGMPMVYVPGGDFMMGSDYLGTAYARQLCFAYSKTDAVANCQSGNFGDESPAHPVTLSGFWIDQTEVTNGQYQACVQDGACTPPGETRSHDRPHYFGNPDYVDYPVIFVTREQAIAYCGWTGGRLPTEAEWEYAARGPESWTYPWGNEFDGSRLNYCDVNCSAGPNDPIIDDGYAETAPVGSFPSGASWVGALDMAGNVREWVADGYGPYTFDAQVNPTGPATGDSIPRGGSWLDLPDLVRSANRGGNVPGYNRDYYGFRCVVVHND
jgi:formylglycine-generating enzyme required for sulfatase activity